MKRPLDVIDYVLVRVDKFILPAIFILDFEVDLEVLIILGSSFLPRGKTVCDIGVDDEQVLFHVCKSMCQPNSNEVCSFVDLVTDVIVNDTSNTIIVDDMLESILLNFDDNELDDFMEYVNSLQEIGSLHSQWRLRIYEEELELGGRV